MDTVNVICKFCGKGFARSRGNYNEAIKMGWHQFCSVKCQRSSKQRTVNGACKTCGFKIARQRSRMEPSGNNFCSHTCSAKYTNQHRLTRLVIARRNRKNAKPICANPNCDKQIGIDNKQFCSPTCRYEACKIKDQKYVIKKIGDFVKKHGRIPIKHELPALYSRARCAFGTWNGAIDAAGFEPNPVRFSKHFIANDGHHCDSLSEKIIDDWLFARKIYHEVKVKYPWNNGMSADFKVGKYWIELFGLTGQLKSYDRLMKIKLEKIDEYKLSLISIYLGDLFPSNRLGEKLGVLQR
ncbi:hypothetical protein HYU91_01035 [Candidatus Collierbacteria bacterium]|nr:hypothetical protein [Candidatus Collierbacteria bacterium]